ncbi:MAG TPA: Gldg family protein [bacterium]|nr:Gldg family protein [bacterium]
MNQSLNRFQLFFVSVVLLATLAMVTIMVTRNNRRWDLTGQKIYSLSSATLDLLQQMRPKKVEVYAFFAQDDPNKNDFEIFLKECKLQHNRFEYRFYDPDRVPQLAKRWRIKEIQTVIIRYEGREERIINPHEQTFANALLRLVNPRVTPVCFVTGHGEAGLWGEERNGLKLFREALEENNYAVHEILLARDKVPDFCQVMIVPGPQRDWSAEEFTHLRQTFEAGKSILFLLDPVDPGTGQSFDDFMKNFGIRLGADVIVDKMSRMVGGDFLVPFVNQYAQDQPVTAAFEMATFFPVARSVQLANKIPAGLAVSALAFSGSGSWAETNLATLEKGEAAFEAETDFPGPIPIAVVIEKIESASEADKALVERKIHLGRMVVVGDSDFITNAYLDLAGNKDFVLRAVQWLSKDDRSVSIAKSAPQFQALFLDTQKRLLLLSTTILGYPLSFLLLGAVSTFLRRRGA